MVGTVFFFLYLGSTAARRGDVIRCTVMFEDKLQVDGETRVPVVFSVNGSRIVPCLLYTSPSPRDS